MATFLKLEDPANSLSFWILNVVDFRREPLRWQGSLRPAFDNTLLSTQRDPRWTFTCTVEFDNANSLQAFIAFCSTQIDFQTGRPTGLRPLRMRSDSSPSGALWNGGPMDVLVEIGGARPSTQEVVAGVHRQKWQQDLVLREG